MWDVRTAGQFSIASCVQVHPLTTHCHCSVNLILITFSIASCVQGLKTRIHKCSLHGSESLVQQELGRSCSQSLCLFVLILQREVLRRFSLIVIAYPREIRASTLTKRDSLLHTRRQVVLVTTCRARVDPSPLQNSSYIRSRER